MNHVSPQKLESTNKVWFFLVGVDSWSMSDEDAAKALQVSPDLIQAWRNIKSHIDSESLMVPVTLNSRRFDLIMSCMYLCTDEKVRSYTEFSSPNELLKSTSLGGVSYYDCLLSSDMERIGLVYDNLCDLFFCSVQNNIPTQS